ncbi:glycoside hydrolase family 15 protein [Fulvivirgaceae bacterium PWU5]|uniref:Glycoside hydrolase family 15 protein n=1 Tax=Dawidia cretensis TaxID=2782350 RepID=A0AAP2GT06_9BACT|nr:glycoside hydrolase family 15 protein [Dawidia cretensis]MBT1707758.1 glycoside hydrolase family 15 protein [Dawidia cretensis]
MEDLHTDSYLPIEHYGIIGNLKTVALVSLTGSIDFMSFPTFDSPTVFARLLDAQKGGSFSITPVMQDYHSKQLYLPGTAVLLTRFFSDEGIAELTDFMPIVQHQGENLCAIVRQVTAVRGDLTFRMECHPAFHYGQATANYSFTETGVFFRAEHDGGVVLRLLADVPLQLREGTGYTEFVVRESETVHIVLESVSEDETHVLHPIGYYINTLYDETINFWRHWISQSTYRGRWTEIVHRSAITLKLLTSYEHGSMVAAATFGLPETIGGVRNWDYRYTWIRDAAFTMYAFLRLGFTEEATAFLHWIHARTEEGKLYLMYTIDGRHELTERELPHLEGYKGSRPVRIGNGAQEQLQLDIYGELIDTIYIYNNQHHAITYEFWQCIVKQVECVIADWRKPDHSIWEVRSDKREFLHSRLMCWVAMDRAIKIADHRSFPYPHALWHAVRDEIYYDVFDGFWNPQVGAWVQYKGADQVDASVLLMPLTHFVSPDEPRWLATLKVVEKTLGMDVLLYRYKDSPAVDGLTGEEGTFTLCSFWYIEALAKSGEVIRALDSFEKMLGYANHLGLFSEQINKNAAHLGNFPQAFTHLALISAALELDKQLDRLGFQPQDGKT